MQYVAEVSGKGKDIDRVKEQLLQSNPVLEGNYVSPSKVIMQYVAEVSGKGKDIDRVKEQLLQSNPVLEGNYTPRKLCL